MAITFTRQTRAAPGKQQEAAQWAAEVAQYVTALGNGELHAHIARFGDISQIGWSTTADSLAELEERQAKTQADDGYQKMVADVQQRGLFDGSITDQVWQQLA